MDPDTSEREVPKWLYKLFTGHAYPYVRRQAKFAKAVTPGEDRPEPTPNEIKAKFWEVYPQCRLKVLQETKTGMIVSFVELGGQNPGTSKARITDRGRTLTPTKDRQKAT